MRLTRFAVSVVICLSTIPAAWSSTKQLQISPQITTRSWQEDQSELAAVVLNGKELIWFKDMNCTGEASNQAEQVAAQLQDSLSNQTLDSPGTPPEEASTKVMLPAALVKGAVEPGTLKKLDVLQARWQIINGIRAAYGIPLAMNSFLKLTRQTGIALASGIGKQFAGRASWYGGKFHGRKTSDGSRFNQHALTAAHRSLPFGTRLLVVNRKTGDTCIVKINDRGPFVANRVLDLSYGAAKQLNMVASGTALVDCLILGSQ